MSLFQSDSGKLITWGSTDDLGQSYVTSGKHGVVQHHIVQLVHYYFQTFICRINLYFLVI